MITPEYSNLRLINRMLATLSKMRVGNNLCCSYVFDNVHTGSYKLIIVGNE